MSSRKRQSDTTIVTSSLDRDMISDAKAAPKSRIKIRIKRFHGVARWTWNAGSDDEVCGICQSAFEGVAPGIKYPGDECPVVFGKCGHAFHLQVRCRTGLFVPFSVDLWSYIARVLTERSFSFPLQCVATWLNSSRQTCPICRYVINSCNVRTNQYCFSWGRILIL